MDNLQIIGSSDVDSNEGLTRGKKENAIRDDANSVPFRFTLYVLGIIGGMPVTWKKPHTPKLHPIESTMMIGVFIYIGMSMSQYTFINDFALRLISSDKLYERFVGIQVVIISMYHFIFLAVWTDVSKARSWIIIWLKLGALHQELFGQRIPMRWRKVEKYTITMVAVLLISVFLLFKLTAPELQLQFVQAPGVLYSCTIVILIGILWIGHFVSVTALAADVNNCFKRELKKHTLSTEKIRIYKKLWLKMRSMSDLLSTLNAPMLIVLVSTIAMIVFIYEIVLFIQSAKMILAVSHVMMVTFILILFYSAARASHNASYQINDLYSSLIAVESLNTLSKDMQSEIIGMAFVKRMRPAVPMFGGFVIANKALVCSILAAISTHFVMLVQYTQAASRTRSMD